MTNEPAPIHSTTAGIVLAAGASSRMGEPKALLRCVAKPLVVHQADLLAQAGCDRVVMVLGSDGERIADAVNDRRVVQHPAWRTGRLSSVRKGLRSVGPHDGYVILPVDTVGVKPSTVAALIREAFAGGAKALRPAFHGRPGRIAWISGGIAAELLGKAPGPGQRLDILLEPHTVMLEVDDDAILSNVNTIDDWRRARLRTIKDER